MKKLILLSALLSNSVLAIQGQGFIVLDEKLTCVPVGTCKIIERDSGRTIFDNKPSTVDKNLIQKSEAAAGVRVNTQSGKRNTHFGMTAVHFYSIYNDEPYAKIYEMTYDFKSDIAIGHYVRHIQVNSKGGAHGDVDNIIDGFHERPGQYTLKAYTLLNNNPSSYAETEATLFITK